MRTVQIAVRLPERLLDLVDDLVARGVYESRAAAVRAGIEVIAERERQLAIDKAIVDGYLRVPPAGVDTDAAMASLRDAIVEEPW